MAIRRDRPEIPDGYGTPANDAYAEWEEIEAHLANATYYWLSTSRPDGRPHAVPRWGVWLDGAFWYDGSPVTRHARNLRQNAHCVLHLESGEEVVIVEGMSHPSAPVLEEHGARLAKEFARKYADLGYAPEPSSWSDETAGGLYVMTPTKVIAWSRFPWDVTRFTFDDRSP